MIELNQTYKFTFAQKFSTLNGVYTVIKIITFETALSSENVNFVTSLYLPAGLSQTDYNTDYPSYRGRAVWALQTVGPTPIVYYVPAPLCASVPDPTVTAYQNVYLSILIGPFADESTYTYLLSQVNDIVSSVTGNPNAGQFFANPAQTVWLTASDYAALQASRQALIKKITPLSVVNQENLTLIDQLKARIAALEAIVINS